jgi:hypothetical protein
VLHLTVHDCIPLDVTESDLMRLCLTLFDFHGLVVNESDFIVAGQAIETYQENHGDLPMYNDIFFYMFEECFCKLIDFERFMDPTWWVSPDGEPGESPFDTSFFAGERARDILTGKLLQYLDFLVANTPWFNGTNSSALDSVVGIDAAHEEPAAMAELRAKMRDRYGTKSAPTSVQGKLKRRRLRLDDVDLGEAARPFGGGRE